MLRTAVPELLEAGLRPLAAADERYGLWAYLVIFLMVLLSSAGVPFLGTLAVGGGAVLASRGHLDLTAVLVFSILGGEAGGIVGYEIGRRWGRRIMERPGRRLDQRMRILDKGERIYAKWGRLAVFFTTAMISGIAKMKFSQFVVWNLITISAFVLAVGPASYGASHIVKGSQDVHDIALLLFGLAMAAGIIWYAVNYRRRRARETGV